MLRIVPRKCSLRPTGCGLHHLSEGAYKKSSSVKLFAGRLVLFTLASMFILSSVFAEEHDDRGPSQISIHVWDYCDPATFNAALGDGTYKRDTTTGPIKLNGFLGEVASDKSAGHGGFRRIPSQP